MVRIGKKHGDPLTKEKNIVLSPGASKMFKNIASGKAKSDAKTTQQNQYVKKHGYENVMHKNVTRAPKIELAEEPVQPLEVDEIAQPVIRGRMPPRGLVAVADEAPMAPPVRERRVPDAAEMVQRANVAAQKKALRAHHNVGIKEANAMYKAGQRIEITPKPPSRAMKAGEKHLRQVQVEEKPVNSKKLSQTEPFKGKTGVNRVPSEPLKKNVAPKEMETQTQHQPKKNTVMKDMWSLLKANPGMSKAEALKKAHGK